VNRMNHQPEIVRLRAMLDEARSDAANATTAHAAKVAQCWIEYYKKCIAQLRREDSLTTGVVNIDDEDPGLIGLQTQGAQNG